MIVAFWSPEHLETSYNALLVSIICAIKRRKKVLLINAKNGHYELESSIGVTDNSVIEDVGLDFLYKISKVEQISEENIKNSSISFYNDLLNIIPGTTNENEIYESQMYNELPYVLEKANLYFDYIFVDMPSSTPIMRYSRLVEKCDKVVVNLSQNIRMIKKSIFDNLIDEEKVIYLIDKYDENSCYNLKNVIKLFPDLKRKITAIPYNIEFLDSIYNSKVVGHMQKKYISHERMEESFIREVEDASNLIIDIRKGGK